MLQQLETRRAPAQLTPKTFNEKDRTFEAVISTGADVQRKDSKGVYLERLDLASIDPASLVGIPVLVDHDPSFATHVGTITAARFESGSLVASVKLTSDSSADSVARKIADGILNAMSLGYSVGSWAETVSNGQRVRTAGNITVVESSLVSTPADRGAKIRTKEPPMPNELIETKPVAPEAGVIAHRAAVRDIAKRSGLDATWADTQIDSGADIASVKGAAHDAMIARATPITVRQVGPSGDDPAVILERRIDGLVSNVTGATPKAESREFAGLRFSDHVRESLQANGISIRGMNNDDLFKRAAMLTVSDFPQLLSGVGNRLLLPSYQANRSPLIKLFAKQNRNDFRAASSLRISEMSELQKVTESGEIKNVGRTESASSYLMETYAGMFSLSRKALINDDLGAFADSSRAFGQAAATTEAKLMVALLESNPVMQEDNTALFHTAKHSNLAAAGAAIAVASLSTARKALRDMKGLDLKTPIAVTPKYLVVSSDNETLGEQVLAAIQPTKSTDVNPFGGKLELLVDPRLAPQTWYVAGDPSQVQCLAYAVLGGNDGPTVEVSNLFDVLGTSVRAYHDFGVGAQDWRGLFKNAGV
jgi:HK97 family phage prohead protease